MTHYAMLSTTCAEWARMWESLFDVAGSYTDCNVEAGEFWQYTGTFWKDRTAIGSLMPTTVLVHQFRHRNRPKTAKSIPEAGNGFGRVVIELSASHEYSGNWNHPIPEGSII